jgi:hypothetical protein
VNICHIVSPVVLYAKLSQYGRYAVKGQAVASEVLAEHLQAEGEVEAAEELLGALSVLSKTCMPKMPTADKQWSRRVATRRLRPNKASGQISATDDAKPVWHLQHLSEGGGVQSQPTQGVMAGEGSTVAAQLRLALA